MNALDVMVAVLKLMGAALGILKLALEYLSSRRAQKS